MNDNLSQSENLRLLDELEQQISGLLERNRQLSQENEILKQQQETLAARAAGLDDKHHKVRSRLESMLKQLNSLEQQ